MKNNYKYGSQIFIKKLTLTEEKIYKLWINNKKTSEIAKLLGISKSWICTCKKNITSKLFIN